MTIEVLKHHEQWFRALIEHSADGIVLMRSDGTMTYASPSAERIIGYTPDELVGMNCVGFIHPDDQQKVAFDVKHMLDHHADFVSVIHRLHHKDGSWRWIEGTITNLLYDPTIQSLVGNYRDITERKQAEERLLQSEERYRVLIEQASDGIFLTDLKGHYLEVNTAACLMSGYSREELLTKRVHDLTAEEDRAGIYTRARPLLIGKTTRTLWHMKCKDGSILPIELSAKRLSTGHLQGIARDVSASLQAEEERTQLLARECAARAEADHRASQLSAIFEAITDIVIVCDEQGRLVHANSAFYMSSGLQPGDELSFATLSQHPAHLQPLDSEGNLLPQEQWPLVRVLRGERLSSKNMVDIFFRSREGYMRSFDVRGAPIFEASGKIVGGVIALRDVTRRRELERRLHRSEREFRSLVESNIIGVIVVDIHGRIREANDCFVHMLGYDREDLLSGTISWQEFTPSQYRKKEEEVISTLFAVGTVLPWEKEYLCKDGKLLPALVGGTLIDQEQGLALVVILDITDRKEVEQRKQEFLSMVSHELRTPLTGIVGFLELAHIYIDEIPKGISTKIDDLISKIELFVQQAEQQAGIQTRLVEELLDVSRMEKHSFELSLKNCDLSKIVQNVVSFQQQIADSDRIDLLPLPQESIPVLVDEDRIGEVLVNYLTNALKYSSADQKIEVGVTMEENSVRVYVRDRGPGLTLIQQQRIWERFYQTGISAHGVAERSGLGLGLYISKIIIAQHKGQVGVESGFGEGSTFWFTLPL